MSNGTPSTLANGREPGGSGRASEILLISDATGTTLESVVTAALFQFGGQAARIRRYPFTRTLAELDEILSATEEGAGIVVFTLVSPDLRERLRERGAEKKLVLVDVMGPLVGAFSGFLSVEPRMIPGGNPGEDGRMRDLAAAIHFARLHDDGRGLDTIDEADVVILGPSRTGKTSTSYHLACRNVKVANVPLVDTVPVPEGVARSTARKVGFRIGISRLLELRAERSAAYGEAGIPGYDSLDQVAREVEYCEEVYRKIPGLRIVDVTDRSVEETSEWIARQAL